ncbi:MULTISPECIES: helicase-associated domain-containing protein [unclassified Gordonia (in: high G+C Gram-positive bacteria)]|uniref:helicase-associated domain-containing protein n=1 Tax=unclassified Gordonia (in: high G+C Gram-positive bacteria) TaxID=2657482 RepID=UPI001F0EDFBE|nr:helicase-associated domain-containing protein [Gordonia sp. ABSL49_1]MCH5641233.1 helicase-associated domain-containing protein [Gordonia sp. ABSL49_1]
MTNTDTDKSTEVRLTEQEALANLRTVLELCASGQLKCSAKTSRASAATVGLVASHLINGDFYPDDAIAAFAWPLLIQSGGLANLDGTRLALTPKGRAALGKPPADVIRDLWRRWLTHGVVDEFSRIDAIKGQRATNVLTAVKPRRATVAEGLAACPPGEWIEVDDLFSTMRRARLNPTIARSERALWKLYIIDAEYGSFGYDGYHDWSLLEGRYTLAVTFEYAGTLGLVDLDYRDPRGARDDYHDNWGSDFLDALSRYDGLRRIRLTPLGAYALGLTHTFVPSDDVAETSSLTVLPNLDIVIPRGITTTEKLTLSAFAAQTADHVWTVSATTLTAALGAGRDLADFVAFLILRSDHELPSPLTTLINDVRRRGAQLTDLGHLRVIECADPAVAALIARDRRLRSLCRQLGDRFLTVAPENEPKFRTALLKLGYVLPTV